MKIFKRLKERIKKNGRRISRITLIAICAGLIIGVMPKVKKVHYDFEVGANWAHENLSSEFDFDVRKSVEEIELEERNKLKNATPFFEELKKEKIASGNSNRENCLIDIVNHYHKNKRIIADSDTAHLHYFSNNKGEQKVIIYNGNFQNSSNKLPEINKFHTLSEIKSQIWNEIGDTIGIGAYLKPTHKCNIEETEKQIKALISQVDPISEKIKEGTTIITKGKEVTPRTARILETYLEGMNQRGKTRYEDNWLYVLLGQSVFIIICLVLLLAYITLYKKDILNNTNKFIFTIIAATIFPIIVGIMTEHGGFSVFILPFAIVPITLCLFVDQNTAFVTSTISLLICSIMVAIPYEFLMLQLAASYCAILTLRDLSSRSQMFKCVTITLMTYSAIYLCYEVINSAGFSSINSMMYVYFVISSILTLFVYPLMFIIERTFGFISSITLIELSNLNCNLLQRMSQETPGTFQHSMQVGNLAAEAAMAIGGNPLEARTGALYHDIGKLENPIYFTENQSGGISPHKRLSPIESAQVIIKHVTNGLAIAERENLPKKIKEFITTHHGISKTGYFYITYKNEHPDEVVDEKLFTYPGPRPFTKEQAVLMMADCVEAASHSIKEYTEENICKLVDNIIDAKFREGELMMAPLTFQDIFTVKEVFKKRLMAIYHTRISYPSEKKS